MELEAKTAFDTGWGFSVSLLESSAAQRTAPTVPLWERPSVLKRAKRSRLQLAGYLRGDKCTSCCGHVNRGRNGRSEFQGMNAGIPLKSMVKGSEKPIYFCMTFGIF